MSFKRVGDDFDDFKVQKKRRVNDLLLEKIPDDEATVMRNGKLVCLVCHYRPVFDTTAVLTIHRQGKKHLANAAILLERAKQDAEIKQKRQHEKYLIELEKQNTEGVNSTAPLLGLTNKNKELALTGTPLLTSMTNLNAISAKRPKNLPFFQPRMKMEIVLRTQIGKESTGTSSSSVSRNVCADKPLSVSKQTCSSSNKREGELHEQQNLQYPNITRTETRTELAASSNNGTKCNDGVSLTREETGNSKSDTSSLSQKTRERRVRAEYLSRMRRKGWILGTDGKWCKDEDAEFDSDEEEPPPPPGVYS